MLTYSKSGVDYSLLDPAKRMSQIAGLKTVKNILDTSYKEISKSRGETAYIIEAADCYHVLVEEGLGTKNLVAESMRKITGKTYYEAMAQDTVAAIVNDIICVGARPLTVLAYWAVGDSKWFADKKRLEDLVNGWKKACNLSGATWGGGETPANTDMVNPSTIILAGASFGIIKPKKRLILGDKLTEGDAIILFASNGIHANGLSLARKIINKIPKGYSTLLENGRMYGEELLKPSVIYARLIEDLFKENIDIHYLVNITGHGWRKIMRARKPFNYILEDIPEIPPLFSFIQKYSGLSISDMYSTFNMGAGFAAIVRPEDVNKVIKIAKLNQIKAYIAGYLEKGERQVVIKPHNISFEEKSLRVRA